MTSSVPPSTPDSSQAPHFEAVDEPWQNAGGRWSSLPPAQAQPSPFRLILVWLVLMTGGVGLVANLFRLQVIDAEKLKVRAQDQQMIYLRPFVPRRPIVDRSGNVLAIDQPAYTLYAHPRLFSETKEAIATKLSPLLKRSAAKLTQQFSRAETGIQVEYSLTEDIANQIKDLQIDGIELIRHQQRLYPQQDLFADVVGYVNLDRKGQAGVEYSQQKLLERSVQAVRLSRTGSGALIPDQVPGGFLHVDALRLQLTLDSRLQRAARYALQQQIKQFNGKRGSVIVMDARDG
ncbi:MAG TPA: hypothetical protein V6C63_20710, partial [Allocoleopsis sp.]